MAKVSRNTNAIASVLSLWMGFGLLVGCARPEPRPEAKSERLSAMPPAPVPSPLSLASTTCEARIRDVYKLAEQPGVPGLEEHRAELLGRARAVPLVFSRAPLGAEVGSAAHRRWEKLLAPEDPAEAIGALLRATKSDLEERRAAVLREGYLFADSPLLGLRLSQMLRLDLLFDAPEVLIERGAETIRARRALGRYYVVPAGVSTEARPDLGRWQEAYLLLFDRVRLPDEPRLPPLGVDLRELRRVLGFDRARVERLTDGRLVLSLSTAGIETTALVRTDQRGQGHLDCEVVPAGREEALLAARATARHTEALVAPVLASARGIVEQRLPFDEPKTEEGQQDGHLRMAFKKAYKAYRETYEFNGDTYYVFDGYGRPRVPEVCIDFITDAFDWATGGGFAGRGQRREYRSGALNFAAFGLENSRSIEQIASFGTDHPEWFDVVWLPAEERVKFYKRREFFEVLRRTSERYRRGDVVFILGLRSDERFHYHSFFVDSVDPLTGVPILLAANAGPAQLRTWEGEMQNAPLRSIVARLRVRPELLERAQTWSVTSPGVPLPAPQAVMAQGAGDLPDDSTLEAPG